MQFYNVSPIVLLTCVLLMCSVHEQAIGFLPDNTCKHCSRHSFTGIGAVYHYAAAGYQPIAHALFLLLSRSAVRQVCATCIFTPIPTPHGLLPDVETAMP